MTETRLRGAIATLALVGAGIAAYLLHARLTGAALNCSTGGCETVQSSRYAELAGVPLPLLGLLAYGTIVATALARGELARAAGVTVALTAMGFGVYLLVVQLAVIGAVCQWCVASDAVATLVAGLALWRFRVGGAPS